MSRPHDPMSGLRTTGYPRTRERSTPTRGLLFTPVLFRLGGEGERERGRLLHFELSAAIGAGHDLALDRVGPDGDLGIALGALRHCSLLPRRERRSLTNQSASAAAATRVTRAPALSSYIRASAVLMSASASRPSIGNHAMPNDARGSSLAWPAHM